MSVRERRKPDWWKLAVDDLEEDGLVPPRKKPRKPSLKVSPSQARSELAGELYQPEAEYNFTYKASRFEQQWIPAALHAFYDDSLISDVLRIVKGGKEANVYCCRAHPTLELDLLAAKIYRPRLLRNLKNDALYKEGRAVLDDEGKAMHDHRSQRAIRKKTRVGAEMTITSWIEYEFQTLRRLYQAGADVPRPVAQSGNAILMAYVGEAGSPAPALSEVLLEPGEVRPLFDRLLFNVRLMLENHLVHADLSAYNVLYWEGELTIIDFPQAVDPLKNSSGFDLLLRDVEHLCQYFDRYGLKANPRDIAGDLWNRYERGWS